MNNKGFINPLWLLVVPVLLLGGGATWWATQKPATQPDTAEPVDLPIAEDTKTIAPRPQQTQLSIDLAGVAPGGMTETRELPLELQKKITQDLADTLIAEGLWEVQWRAELWLSFFAVGKHYVVFAIDNGKDCGAPLHIVDTLTYKLTKLPKLIFVEEKMLGFVSNSAFYTYTPDTSDIVEVPGSRIADPEVFVPAEGLAGVCGNVEYTKDGNKITVEVATPRGGTDPETGDPLLGPSRKLTFALPQ